MHLYSSHVAYDFQNYASDHADHETPCFGLKAEEDLREEEDGEDGDVERISCEGGEVLIVSLEERASCQGTIFVWNCGIG